MAATGWDDDECSVIGDKGEIGFIDFENDASVCNYNPNEEGPVVVSVPFAFKGKPKSVVVGETASDCVTLENTTSDPVELWGVKIFASTPADSFTLSLMEPPSASADIKDIEEFMESFSLEDRVIQPGETLNVWVCCKPKEIGLHTSVVHFDLGSDRVERVIFLLSEDRVSRSLAPKKPYSRGSRKKVFDVQEYVVGKRPARSNARPSKYRLPQYVIPTDVRELVENKQIPDTILEGLTRENYEAYFKTLLIMEEIHMEQDMRTYDMECVTMRRKGLQFLTLGVPGLAEKRPSLVHGDYIFAKLSHEDQNDSTRPYQGFIHRVEAEEVYLGFAQEFIDQHMDRSLYNVRFTYNRVNMRRLYQAVEAARGLEKELLFPSNSRRRLIKATPTVPISSNLNEEQIFSIEMILGCRGAPPYVIHGPPGTGKTKTLVEAILQVYTTQKNARILVCAPSNSAADHLLERLLAEKAVELQGHEIFRLNAISRPYEDINPDFIRFCYSEDLMFRCPPLDNLMRYRIVISTYMSASLLYAGGLKRGHFSHIFLDEAGQASEPETMIPLSHLCQSRTVVVLAGDPMQLGPVIYSKDAEVYCLGKSYLERLFECEFYHKEDENYVTKLVRNYRCRPEILRLPSELFYKGELIPCRDDRSTSMTWAEILPNKEFPVLFSGIQGYDEREGSNPSWFNRTEASKVVEIIKKLTISQELREEDIGVITPYRQQVLKVKQALEGVDMPAIKVGSVEQFQGQEKEVIIISTVRSTIKHNDFDKNHCLGFLSNPRRFNVAITRARSLLIIIGNPHIISKDSYWNKILWHCSDNDSYQGCALPERLDFDDNETMRLNFNHEEFNHEEEENPQPSNEVGWDQGPFEAEKFLKPVTDEADWSDGWK